MIDYREMKQQAWATREIASDVEYELREICDGPGFDEQYKLEWHPEVTSENFKKVLEKLREVQLLVYQMKAQGE